MTSGKFYRLCMQLMIISACMASFLEVFPADRRVVLTEEEITQRHRHPPEFFLLHFPVGPNEMESQRSTHLCSQVPLNWAFSVKSGTSSDQIPVQVLSCLLIKACSSVIPSVPSPSKRWTDDFVR